MSHTVVRGQANASQLYLDTVLDAILSEQDITPDPQQRNKVTLSQIMLYCLKKRPQDEFMTNGATGEVISNEELLKRAISLARALTAQGAKGKYALFMMRNHQDMLVVYFVVIFTGLIPFMVDPNSTVYELTHFLKLVEPSYIFCDRQFKESIHEAVQNCAELSPATIVADEPGVLARLSEGYSDDVASFVVPSASPDDTVMLLPTSGSTGLPKAVMITHKGLVTHLPTSWSYLDEFPTPTDRVMILTTCQWMTFTMHVTGCVAYHIPIVISPRLNSVEHVTEILEKYRPTFAFLVPPFATALVASIRPDQISSLKTLFLLGAPPGPELLAALREKLPKSASLLDGYGTTEAQGFILIPDKDAPPTSNGPVLNFFHYKIVDEEGNTLGPNQSGELWLRGETIFKGYYRNSAAYNETCSPDGWYRTGDVFYVDGHERLSYVIRKKFSFKHRGNHVSPEEVEHLINSIPGVQQSVVCGTEAGPAAAVLLHPDVQLKREQIHQVVNPALSDHKRLHGGIVFVTSLPHTHSGKLKRSECSKLITELIKDGQCF